MAYYWHNPDNKPEKYKKKQPNPINLLQWKWINDAGRISG